MTHQLFGQWLRQARRALDLTQEALAERVACAATTIRTFESGARRPSRDMAERLANVLAIPLDERAAFLKLARARPAAPAAAAATSPPANVAVVRPSVTQRDTERLPRQLTSFIGRQAEVAELGRLLGDTRLLTLTGPGGAGKTRLAFALAAQHAGELALVELAALTTPDLLAPTVAAALGVQPVADHNLTAALVERLRDHEILLLLDNCEHLIAPCAHLAERLLVACPRLRILATSRERLGVPGEVSWRIPGLSLPSQDGPIAVERLAASEAVQLFVDRARARQPSFQLNPYNAAAVARICRRLDGLPLALELAAARVATFGVAVVAARLDDALTLLTGGDRTASRRQQTLRDTIAWSYNLLTAEEQTLLRCLTVFVGGWTLEAAEAVVAQPWTLEGLVRLADQSLVMVEETDDGAVRYRLLEPVRQFAHALLVASGELAVPRARHARFFLTRTELNGSGNYRNPPAILLRWLATESDNIRATLEYLASLDDPLPLAQLCRALARFWEVAGRLSEGRAWLNRALARQELLPVDLSAELCYQAGELAVRQGDYGSAQQHYTQAADDAQRAGAPHLPQLLAYVWRGLGWAAYCQGDDAAAAHWYDQSRALFEQLGDREGAARILISLGELAMLHNDPAGARELHTASLHLLRELGNQRGEAVELINLGWVELHERALHAAIARFRAGLRIAEELADQEHSSECLMGIAGALGAAGGDSAQLAHAARLMGAADALREAIGLRVPAMYRARFEQLRAALEGQIGASAFADAHAAGQSLSLRQAMIDAHAAADRFVNP